MNPHAPREMSNRKIIMLLRNQNFFQLKFQLHSLFCAASLLGWNLISLVNLLAFLSVQYAAPKIGSGFWRQYLPLRCICIFSFLAVLFHAIFYILLAIEGDQWNLMDAQWVKMLGFVRYQSWRSPSELYFLVIQILVAVVCTTKASEGLFEVERQEDSKFEYFCYSLERIGSRLKIPCYSLLPSLQLMVGISYPSWASFPFFICSSIGLINWSLTSNFLGLFWGWKYLLRYAGVNIFLLHVYQLPIGFSENFVWIAESFGLYKVSTNLEPSQICSGLSLILFYILLSWIRCNLAESDFYKSTTESDLDEQLLPSKNSFFSESRASLMYSSILFWRTVFQAFSINFFTYGFPISLFALSFWSFHFASLCSFGLLAYVGYILYAFPSLLHLHRLNGLLLGFILLWAASTYVFNLAFTVLNRRLHKDMEIWEAIGLWRYPVPGFYLLAQFGLGVLVAMGNLVNSSVFLSLSDGDREFIDENQTGEDKEAMKVLVVATVAWILRKSYRAFLLYILFLVAIRPGFIHAAYMIFFLVYLLSHTVSTKTCQALILLCEAHFALLYILQLNLISKLLDRKGGYAGAILTELGLYKCDYSGDYLKIAVIICFCTIHSHGIQLLFSFSTIVQQSPSPPIGFSVLKAGLIKSVIFSVYTSRASERQNEVSSHERLIVTYLSAIGQKFLSIYRSCGTYISFLTILLPVYLVMPNYVSCGYLFFLLTWVIGRQLLEKTTKSLWFPLKLYAVAVFIFIYSLSVFFKFRMWLSGLVNLYSIFGYNPEASIPENVWESLAILISIQLFSYERRWSKFKMSPNSSATDIGNLTFSKRLLILHGEKILYLAVLYASLSPVSAFGCLYLLGLIIFLILPKSSQVPSKLFLVYSGLYAMTDYLFQMWGHKAEMFPGQKNYYLSLILGLQLYEPGFQGLESGLRGKIMVIIACILQYSIYHWLDKTPYDRGKIGYERCTLFDSTRELFTELTNLATETGTPPSSSQSVDKRTKASQSQQYFSSGLPEGSVPMSSELGGSQGSKTKDYLFSYFWESRRGSNKWNRKRIIYFRKERFHKQKMMLKIYIKYWIENMFNLFGLEINMVALLVASFAVLNTISLVYVAALATCVFLHRSFIQKIWPMFVFLFASIVGLEYLALWWNLILEKQHDMGVAQVSCHDCWRISDHYLNFCKKCWLGLIVDDSRMLGSYYVVFMFSCFKLHADRLSSLPASLFYQHLISHNRIATSLNDLSFETKELWTLLDYLRHYTYCHLLDLVLALILITGTLEYDILHFGYLGFALIFFRLRLEILDKKNKIFKFLRIYNFALIVLSLAYQSPFIGDFIEGKSATIDFISEVVGFYKYDYGFRITSRSALVEIIIFMLVALQSSMFSSEEFNYVSKYLEAEQIGTIVREQEKRTAWKTAQLQHIRKSEEQKHQRNLQVEKMKSEMLNLQNKLHNIGTTPTHGNNSSEFEDLGRRSSSGKIEAISILKKVDDNAVSHSPDSISNIFSLNVNESPKSDGTVSQHIKSTKLSVDFLHEISEHGGRDVGMGSKSKSQSLENPLISAVHLIGGGVSQVQSLSNQAVNNLVSFLNIENGDSGTNGSSSEDEIYYEIESYGVSNEHMEQTTAGSSSLQLGVILRFIWAQMRSNNEIVCYMCFVLIFLWNFSLLSMVYLAALFLYALCVNTGPTYMFWVIMLIYSEVCISLQYVYQIMIQHCGLSIQVSFLEELGFPMHEITSSFVIGNFPLFLVYLFTLLQTTIAARDGNWKAATKNSFRRKYREEASVDSSYTKRIRSLFLSIVKLVNRSIRGLCRYWKSLTEGAETPPYFVQVSMEVKRWPEDGIQPARIESGINKVLRIMYDQRYENPDFHLASRVQVQSIERSTDTPNIALAVFEVLRASPLTGSALSVWHKSLTPAADVASEILTANDASLFKQIRFPYPIVSVIGGGKREIDLYAYIFCADLAVFFLVSMFYQSIIKNKSEFLEVYQLEDQFPKEFVFILMVIFFLIVLDRVIYLCSFSKGKVIFYLFSLGLFTYSAARYAWYTAPPNKHAGRLALRAIYLTKAVSLALQAVQIRYGIPHESSLYRQFLTSNISKLNYMGFRLYRALPFLYELRCVLDWSCTTTSLTMYDWLKLEDIHASLFLVKCDAILNRAAHKSGERQTKKTKFYGGICLFFVLICVIWMPMLMYSSGNPTNIANPIKDAGVRIDIKTESGRLTVFETTLCEKLSWEDLAVENDMDPLGYLTAYDVKDIQLICCQADASTLWHVPPVVQARFSKSLAWSMKIIFSWQLTRDRPKGKEVVKYELGVEEKNLPQPSTVMEVLNGTTNNFTIYDVYPRYFRVTGSGDVRLVEQALEFVSGDLVLNRGNPEWWSFHDIDAPRIRGCGSLAGPMAIVVSEETPQGILGETLSKFSISGLYITFVLAVGRFIRLQCADLRMRIPFENLPSCDRLLAICEDIYAARAEGELKVEEVLYWTLVKIYRSPHMLLEYTKTD